MNLPQIFTHEEFGEVRSFDLNGKPYFVGNDIARALEYARPHEAVSSHCKGAVTHRILTNGGEQETKIVPEGDIYRLIVKAADQTRSQAIKIKAEKFESWIFDEVIPMIRKTGGYVIPQTMPETLRLLAAEMEKNQAIEAENRQLALQAAEQDQKLQEQATPVAIYNLAISSHNTMSMQEVAKSLGTGRTKLYQILREENIIMKNSTMPYQRYLDSGHFKVTERPRASGDTIMNDPATRVYAKGFDLIARLLHKRSKSKVS